VCMAPTRRSVSAERRIKSYSTRMAATLVPVTSRSRSLSRRPRQPNNRPYGRGEHSATPTEPAFGGSDCNPTGVLFEAQNTVGEDVIDLGSTAAVNDGAWHWVAVTRQTTTASLYVDGQLQATTTTATTADISKSTPMRAGVSSCDGVDGTTPLVDELMIFEAALTQSQIQTLGS
jgi:hypothetical protein